MWHSKQKSQAGPGFSIVRQSAGLLGGRHFSFFADFRTIDQFDECHRRIVTLTETHLQDTQIAAVAVCIARAEFGEQLEHDVAVAQAAESQALVREIVSL